MFFVDPLPTNKIGTKMTSHKEKQESLTEEEKDVYECALEKSGCSKFHFALQDCYYEHKDWRKCKKEMADLKKCTDEQIQKKAKLKSQN